MSGPSNKDLGLSARWLVRLFCIANFLVEQKALHSLKARLVRLHEPIGEAVGKFAVRTMLYKRTSLGWHSRTLPEMMQTGQNNRRDINAHREEHGRLVNISTRPVVAAKAAASSNSWRQSVRKVTGTVQRCGLAGLCALSE